MRSQRAVRYSPSCLVAAALFAVVAGATSAGEGQAGRPSTETSCCEADPILSRLVLNKEISQKVEPLLAEGMRKMAEAARAGTDAEGRREALMKAAEEMYLRVREVLPADMRERFDVGRAILSDSMTRAVELRREMEQAAGSADRQRQVSRKMDVFAEEAEELLDEKVGPKPGTEPEEPLPEPTGEICRNDPVLARLGLSDELAKLVDGVMTRYQRRIAREVDFMVRELGGAVSPLDLLDRREVICAVRDRKIREMLPEELRPRFDAGAALAEKFNRAIAQAGVDAQTVVMEPGRPGPSPAEREDECKREAARLTEEFSKALDEKVGKLPDRK